MGLPHGEMLARMPASEITEWRGYEKVTGPLGGDRDDVLATLIAFYVVKALGAKKARLDKMLPDWDRQPQDWRQMREIFKALTIAGGGEINDPPTSPQ